MLSIYFTITWVVYNVLRRCLQRHDTGTIPLLEWPNTLYIITDNHSTSYGLGNIGRLTLYTFKPYCLYRYTCVYSGRQHSHRYTCVYSVVRQHSHRYTCVYSVVRQHSHRNTYVMYLGECCIYLIVLGLINTHD